MESSRDTKKHRKKRNNGNESVTFGFFDVDILIRCSLKIRRISEKRIKLLKIR